MPADHFEERLAKIRERFAASLEGRIADACEALPQLFGQESAVIEKVAETYRQLHGICGIGATVGFIATGKAARDAETVLLAPFRGKRGLTGGEGERLQKMFEALQAAARLELQSLHRRGEAKATC
jgi:chemotaxis protein histidine kinase CheA